MIPLWYAVCAFAAPDEQSYPLAWAEVGTGVEASLHHAAHEPELRMGIGTGVRLTGRTGVGRRFSAVLGLSAGWTLMVDRDPQIDSVHPVPGLIGEGGARWAFDPRWGADLLLGYSVGGGADSGPVASIGIQRAVLRGEMSLGLRLRLPSALLGRGFFDGCNPVPGTLCIRSGVRVLPGTLGFTLELAARTHGLR